LISPREECSAADLWRAPLLGENGCESTCHCEARRSRCWRRSATAVMPGLDLSSFRCLRLPAREFRSGSRSCKNTQEACFRVVCSCGQRLAATEPRRRSFRRQRQALNIPRNMNGTALLVAQDRRLAGANASRPALGRRLPGWLYPRGVIFTMPRCPASARASVNVPSHRGRPLRTSRTPVKTETVP